MILTPEELAYIASHPDGIRLAMDFHETQQTGGEAMGHDGSAHETRFFELAAMHDKVLQEWGLKIVGALLP